MIAENTRSDIYIYIYLYIGIKRERRVSKAGLYMLYL